MRNITKYRIGFLFCISLFLFTSKSQAQITWDNHKVYRADVTYHPLGIYFNSFIFKHFAQPLYPKFRDSLFRKKLLNELDSVNFHFEYAEEQNGSSCTNYFYEHLDIKLKKGKEFELKMAFHPDEQIYQCIRGNYKIIADTTIHFYPTQDLINNFVTIENLDKDHSFREILLPTKVKNIEILDNPNTILDTTTIKRERLLTKKWHFKNLAYANPQLYNAGIIDHFHFSLKRCGDAIEYTTDSSIIFPVLRLRIPNDVNKLKIVVNEQQYEIVIPKGNGLYFPRMYQYTNVSNFDMKWRIKDDFFAPYFGASKLVTSVQLELLSFPVPQKWHKIYLFFRNDDENYQPCNFYPK